MLSISKIKIRISVTCLQSGSTHIKIAHCNAAFQGSMYTWASVYPAYSKKLILPEAQETSRGGVTFKLSSDAGPKKKKEQHWPEAVILRKPCLQVALRCCLGI